MLRLKKFTMIGALSLLRSIRKFLQLPGFSAFPLLAFLTVGPAGFLL
jgi:hypothetical protein